MRFFYSTFFIFFSFLSLAQAEHFQIIDFVKMSPDKTKIESQQQTFFAVGIKNLEEYQEQINKVNGTFENRVASFDVQLNFALRHIFEESQEKCKSLDPRLVPKLESIRIELQEMDEASKSKLEATKKSLITILTLTRQRLENQIDTILKNPLLLGRERDSTQQSSLPENTPELVRLASQLQWSLAQYLFLSQECAARNEFAAGVLSNTLLIAGAIYSMKSSSSLNELAIKSVGTGLACTVFHIQLKRYLVQSLSTLISESSTLGSLIPTVISLQRDLDFQKQWAFRALECIGREGELSPRIIETAKLSNAYSEFNSEIDVSVSEIFDLTCAFCFDGMEIGQEITKGKCGHGFHQACIAPYFEQAQKCPTCSQPLSQWHRVQGTLTKEEERN